MTRAATNCGAARVARPRTASMDSCFPMGQALRAAFREIGLLKRKVCARKLKKVSHDLLAGAIGDSQVYFRVEAKTLQRMEGSNG